MTEVALFEAKNRLSELIERVLAGETIAITRRGRVVAQLTAPNAAHGAQHAQQAVDHLRQCRQGVSVGRLKARDLLAEGRR